MQSGTFDSSTAQASVGQTLACFNNFQQQMLSVLAGLPTAAQASGSSLFSSTCSAHCTTGGADFWTITVNNDGVNVSMASMVADWWFANNEPKVLSTCNGYPCMAYCVPEERKFPQGFGATEGVASDGSNLAPATDDAPVSAASGVAQQTVPQESSSAVEAREDNAPISSSKKVKNGISAPEDSSSAAVPVTPSQAQQPQAQPQQGQASSSTQQQQQHGQDSSSSAQQQQQQQQQQQAAAQQQAQQQQQALQQQSSSQQQQQQQTDSGETSDAVN
jgi:hypothetical protein